MGRLVAILVCLSMLVNGCKSQPLNEAGLYQRPGWWERRMDRLEDWNTHHGYALSKAKSAIFYTAVVGGTLSVLVACAMIKDESSKKPGQKNTYDDSWFWSTPAYGY